MSLSGTVPVPMNSPRPYTGSHDIGSETDAVVGIHGDAGHDGCSQALTTKALIGIKLRIRAFAVERVTRIELALSAWANHVIGPDMALTCSFWCPHSPGGNPW
jgi:hypothetical protein